MRTITRLGAGTERLAPYLERIREDAAVVTATPESAQDEARDSNREEDPPHIEDARDDATDLPLITVDPPGSKDLDQALHIEPMAGARLLLKGGAGVLRTMPTAEDQALRRLLRIALAFGVR